MAGRKDADEEILAKSKYVTEGLDALNEKLKFNEIKMINSMDAMLHHQDDVGNEINISSDELVRLFNEYLQINEYKRL